MKSLLVLTFIISFSAFANGVNFENLTANDPQSIAARNAVIDNKSNSGVRLAWDGMKEMNKVHGPDQVDASVAQFEEVMQRQLASEGIQNVQIRKMDFKGYYITCTPTPGCTNQLESAVKRLPPGQIGNGQNFNLVSATAGNYEEGYIKARTMAAYGDRFKEGDNLTQFINNEVKASIREAFGASANTDLSKLSLNDPAKMEGFTKTIEDMRQGRALTPEQQPYKRLVDAMDNLLEAPFKASNNLDAELKAATSTDIKAAGPGKYKVSTAISGDDLFVVLKDHNGNTVKVIGADARGLAVTNMSTRYEEVVKRIKAGESIDNFRDILNLTSDATDAADKRMADSISEYVQSIQNSIDNMPAGANLDDALRGAHEKYHRLTIEDPSFMQMRTAAIPSCNPTPSCIQSEVTTIHNMLKKMEAKGIEGHFGDSCLGVQYWLRKLGQ